MDQKSEIPADPMLDPAHQHQHAHHHHTTFAEQGREEEVVYAQETTFDKGVPEPTPLEQSSKSSDEEAGQNYPAQRTWLRRVGKQWRHIVHAVIWLLFTG